MQFAVLSHSQAGHTSATVSAPQLIAFGRAWPCFGDIASGARLFAVWDSNGDIVDIQGADGLNESGVAALCDDMLHAILQRNPAWECAGHRARLGL